MGQHSNGLVAFMYSAIGGLMVGAVLAVLIGLIRKSKNPESSFLVTFSVALLLTETLSAVGIFMLFMTILI